MFFAALISAFVVAVGPAQAAEIRECGRTADVRNITTRGVFCSTARSFARAYIVSPACTEDQRCRLRRFTCRNRVVRSSVDARCTRGSRVIRFQHDYV